MGFTLGYSNILDINFVRCTINKNDYNVLVIALPSVHPVQDLIDNSLHSHR